MVGVRAGDKPHIYNHAQTCMQSCLDQKVIYEKSMKYWRTLLKRGWRIQFGQQRKSKLHKLGLGCDSDYDGAQLWINPLVPTYTHIHTHTANTTSGIVSHTQKSFQSGGDPVIPHRLEPKLSSSLRSLPSRENLTEVLFTKWTRRHQMHEFDGRDR